MEYTWTIYHFDCAPIEGSNEKVIKRVHWGYTLTDGDFSVNEIGMESLESPTGEFIPFEELTEEIVLNWLSEKLNFELLRNNLQQSLELKKNPPTISLRAPWFYNHLT